MNQYQALYRKYRPEIFSEIIGQEHIVRILKHQIATDTVSHAYLFCGTRGTGKTTVARILAKAVNCSSHGERPCGKCDSCKAISRGRFMDVIEIDAASNNGVDNIRDLRESVNYPPGEGKKKVYIIDEVHMLSSGAYNALLKTLEEPPEHVMFILATTNPEKMPQTVLSRCMRLDFKRVAAKRLMENMKMICKKNGVDVTEDALSLLSSNADGSVRDSLSLLEQCLSGGNELLDRETVLDYLGAVSQEFYRELTDNAICGNVSAGLLLLDEALQDGKDVKQIMKDWMAYYRSLLIAKFVENPADMLNMSRENIEKLKEQSHRIKMEELNKSIMTLAKTINDSRYSTQARILMEVAIVTISEGLDLSEGERKEGAKRQAEEPETVKTADNAANRNAPSQPETYPLARNSRECEAQAASDNCEKPFSEEDLEHIWEDIVEKAVKVKPSMNLIRQAKLVGINASEFKLSVTSEFMTRMVKMESRLISELMEERTGKYLKLTVSSENNEEESKSDRLARDAVEVSKLLGTEVKIK
ncbi:MAG: DNA polymerase III subunit gamma/tau [Hornefia sp.]|nr:DNA polymerase III subunit gamma/tau [Hornefia sp.]